MQVLVAALVFRRAGACRRAGVFFAALVLVATLVFRRVGACRRAGVSPRWCLSPRRCFCRVGASRRAGALCFGEEISDVLSCHG